MDTQFDERASVADLKLQKVWHEVRIKRLEEDLHSHVELTRKEKVEQVSNKIILKRILEIERDNLARIDYALTQRKRIN
jgi:hypothetical protein